MVSLCSQFQHRTPEQIELDRHFGGHGRVNDTGQFVSSENFQGVVFEIEDGDEAGIANHLQSLQCYLEALIMH